mgnify:CR=1 FL=1
MERQLGPNPREEEDYWCVICELEMAIPGRRICRGCLEEKSSESCTDE